ncbi:hypothetical protein Vretimale_18992 [Volvox reticuliferus]|uniref:HECT-type E3 ubiquitin transferase n=1 Tax=Volvox reticuliferus TaxID=1737510 RepID=A0A8J4LZB1_9CHLO|nr:hypothetical protein Vretifemale_13131 [Volvox reticuliferus]GIM16392.1 hypothetical protein Vretimale_18992 [Volvox reticuliferus]
MSSREAQVADRDKYAERTNKMARVGRKYGVLFELAALAGSETAAAPPEDWAGKLLRVMSSASWADPSFLEELSESELVRSMCRALPVLKANAANRATAGSVQDLADLEESMRKLRHELALAEKRLPSHGILGTGGSAFYTTWGSIGNVCTLMLQALTYSTAWCQSMAASNLRASPSSLDALRSSNVAASPASAVGVTTGEASATPQATGPVSQAADASTPLATPAAGAGGGASGVSTPRGTALIRPLGGGSSLSPNSGIGSGSSMPALATEGTLLKLLGNKHVVGHAGDVMRVVPEPYKAALARILLTQISKEMKATQSGLDHILQILHGDPGVTSPAPSVLPKAWFATAALLAAYGAALRPYFCAPAFSPDKESALGDAVAPSPDASGATATTAAAPERMASLATRGRDVDLDNGGGLASESSLQLAGADSRLDSTASGDSDAATPKASDAYNDAEMADAATAAAQTKEEDGSATDLNGSSSVSGLAEGAVGASAPETPPAWTIASGNTAGMPATPSGGQEAGGNAKADDPRADLVQILQGVASALCEAVTGAHGVSRMAILLRGEAAVKFPNAAAYMPAALSINELMGHLDGLACVATALGASDNIQPTVAALLTNQAMKELLGAGKVYVTTVIAAGALTRDLEIDAVIPQSLRQGYMAAVLTPLETGALLNERRAPQVLAYRNSITESSYYQVMDAESLPYGVNVRFEDEQEAEGMGVVREWLTQIAADIFSPERGLFVRGAADKRVIHPSPDSRLQEDYLGYMRFAGRIVGLAVRANVPLGVVLSTGLFNYLTGRRATLQDLQQIDPQVYTTCQNILSDSGSESLELFHVWHTSDERGGEQELVPGGTTLLVTDANKAEYVQLLANHVVVTVIEEQCAAFLAGFQDTAHHLPDDARLRRAFLTPLVLEDLNRITAGESTLDPDDWAQHTDVAGFEGEEHGNLDMFWQLASEYGPEDRQRLLQFWTAMTHLPSGGFKALNQRLQIMKLGPSSVRHADGEPVAGDRATAVEAAAAAAGITPAMDGHRPSVDGVGPHSHRLDGESLEVEEQQSDGMEGGLEDALPNLTQQQSRDSSAQGRTGTSVEGFFRSPGAGEAVPAAEADVDLSRDEGATGEAVVAALEEAVAAVASGGSAASAQVLPLGDLHGAGGTDAVDEPDIPYGEDGEDMGGGEDGIDYGEEAEDEEFQRQLEMALALSLQDMSAAPAQGSRSESGSGGAAGAEAPGGLAAGVDADGRAADATAQAAAQGDEAPLEAAANQGEAAAAAATETGGTFPRHEDAASVPRGVSNVTAVAAADVDASRGTDPDSDIVAALQPAVGSGIGETNAEASSSLSGSHGGAMLGSGADGGSYSNGTLPDALGCTSMAGNSPDAIRADAASAAATEAADDPDTLGPARDSGDGVAAGGMQDLDDSVAALPDAESTDGAVTAPQQSGTSTQPEPMDTDSGPGEASFSHGGEATAAGVAPGAAEELNLEDTNMETELPPSSQQGQEGVRQGGGPRAPQEQEQQQIWEDEVERQRAGVLRLDFGSDQGERAAVEGQPLLQTNVDRLDELQEQQDTPSQVTTVAPAVDAMGGVGAAADSGGGSEMTAAGAPSQGAARVLPLLPQARTCFLQLNLPIYADLDDMRRAFAIALDNMSFGLH